MSDQENKENASPESSEPIVGGSPSVESADAESPRSEHIGTHPPEAPVTFGKPGTPTDAEFEENQTYWLNHVYQGDRVPQLTLRAVLMGGFLGALMSISNLYTTLKVGWSFGVAITACVLSFVIWRCVRVVLPMVSPMSILENNCMQSTASAAGYSTGATIGTAFGALLLITGVHIDWMKVLPWTICSAALGVFIAVPMKRQMINREQLAFPSGIAAAETLKSLYAQSKEALTQAYSLVSFLVIGGIVGFFKGDLEFLKAANLKLPDLIPIPLKFNGVDISKFQAFGFEPSILLIGSGMIVGTRVCVSMFCGALLLYLVVGPYMLGITQTNGTPEIADAGRLIRWSLWPGTALLVASGLTSFALQWKTIVKAFTSAKAASKGGSADASDFSQIEVPGKWLMIGLIPLSLLMIFLQYISFSISPILGAIAVILSFFLALVACRSTGETDITPIGPMGKITQLAYAALAPSNITTNLMAASVTANIASSSADLLTDLKSGYLLGANARRQFIAQFVGVFFGALAIVPAWYLMIPNKETLEKYEPPAANMWKAVAEALVKGIEYIPEHARAGILVGATVGIVLAIAELYAPKNVKKYLPSSMGLGLSWVVPFANSFSFFIGAMIAEGWNRFSPRTGNLYVIPVASGAIAGESLMCAILAMYTAALALSGH